MEHRVEGIDVSAAMCQEDEVNCAVNQLDAGHVPVLREGDARHQGDHHQRACHERESREQTEKQQQADGGFGPRQCGSERRQNPFRQRRFRHLLREVGEERGVVAEQAAEPVEENIYAEDDSQQSVGDAPVGR